MTLVLEKFINFGNNTNTIYGKAKPKDIHKKINIIVGFDAIIEKPTAVPKMVHCMVLLVK